MNFFHIVLAATLMQTPAKPAGPPAPTAALGVQVMLDRAGFSPGAIDGQMGRNTAKALALYKEQGGDATAAAEAVTQYTITPEDAAGPYFADLPSDLMEQSKLPALGYRTTVEALAERFHSAPALLQKRNPGAAFAAGDIITVPNVEPLVMPAPRPTTPEKTEKGAAATASAKPATAPVGSGAAAAKADAPQAAAPVAKPDVVVTVSKAASALTVTNIDGKVLFYAPVTTGSKNDPLPIGEWKVNGVQWNPTFRYNPALFWDADPTHSKAMIPAGPNNPVGLVWVDINKEHYGLHGTPEPATIGRAESHGCVRLTNWDAVKVAALVKPGTRVVFTE